MNAKPSRFPLRRHLAAGLALALLSASALAGPGLRCHLEHNGKSRVIEVAPVADPYAVPSLDIDERFRFKAVVVGDSSRVEYVKLYVYYQTDLQPVLLQQAKYLAPAVQAGASQDALTGLNYLYAPGLGREFQYGCTMIEAGS